MLNYFQKYSNLLTFLPVGTATVERSFSQTKLIKKSRLRSRISARQTNAYNNDLKSVDFNNIQAKKTHRIQNY